MSANEQAANEPPFDIELPCSPIDAEHDLPAFDSLLALWGPRTPGERFGRFAWITACVITILVAGSIVWGWGFRISENTPGFWQISLVAMLFWLGVSQGMMALGAAVRVFHASWRYPFTRLLDMGSLFGVWGIALLPFLVIARQHIYALGSAHVNNNVWRVAGSDTWDCLAVGTSFIAGWMLFYLTYIPDITHLNLRAAKGSGLHWLTSHVAMLWTGEQRQWTLMRRAEGVLVVGTLIAFVASQTILGWDFQLASARDWDSSIFAPLYTLGSMMQALAMIILLATLIERFMPRSLSLEPRHYDNLARIGIVVGLIWFYFRWCDYLTAWYEHIPDEWQIQGSRIMAFPVLAALMVIGCFILPVFPNMVKSVRQSPAWQCVIACGMLIGIVIQRYLDTVPTFAPNYPNSALVPTAGSVFVFLGMTAMFVLTYLVAVRFVPVVSLWGRGRETTRTASAKFGNGDVTVMVQDPPLWET